MGESVTVAAGGTVDRSETCSACGCGMFYRLAKPQSDIIRVMFCGNLVCPRALQDFPLSGEAARPEREGA